VLRIVAAHDLGQTINPLMAEGQIEGALAQGVGYALTEEAVEVEGRIKNTCFLDYKMLFASYLWQIRERYGKAFGDRLMAYTTKETEMAFFHSTPPRVPSIRRFCACWGGNAGTRLPTTALRCTRGR
jgi:hypothetical protein